MKKNRSFKKELIYSFLTVALISIIFLGAFQMFQISSLIKENQNTQNQTTKFFAEFVSNYVESHKTVIETQADEMESLKPDEDYDEILHKLKNVKDNYPGFINLYLADSAGEAVIFYPEISDYDYKSKVVDFSDRSYFKDLVEEKDTVISSVFQGKGGTNKQLITIATPILDENGELERYLLGALDLTALKERIHSQGFGTEGFPVILDQNNNAIIHPDVDTSRDIVSFSDTEIVTYIDDQYSDHGSNFFDKTKNDEREFITYKKLSNLGWTVWLEKPASVITDTYKKSILTIIIFMVATAIIMVGISLLLTNRMERTIKKLLGYIHSYIHGEKGSRQVAEVIEGPKEFEELSFYFSEMMEEVDDRKQALINLNEELEEKVKDRTSNLKNRNLELNAMNKLITSVSSDKDLAHFIQYCLREVETFKKYSIHVLTQGIAVSNSTIMEKPSEAYIRENLSGTNQHIEKIQVGMDDESFLVIDLEDGQVITRGEQEFLQTFASSLAIMLKNKYLFDRFRNKHAELEAVLESMSEGVMLLNNYEQVEYVNEFFMNVITKANEDKDEQLVLDDVYMRLNNLFDVEEEELQAFFRNNEVELKLEQENEVGKKVFYLLYKFTVELDEEKIGQGLLLHDITKEEEIDTLKNNLISLTSHEFKTPITNIKGSVETLLRSDVEWEPEFQQELLVGVHEDIERIQHLVSDWMDISKIESGTMYVERNMIRSDHVIEESMNQIPEELRKDASFEFYNHIDAYLFFYADKQRVQQVLINLFTNALRYNDAAHKEIKITLEKIEDYITISVADNGIGISLDEINRIFNRFYQVDASATRRTGGTGLGLAICKGIMEAHEGKIEVMSEPGKGSIFTLYFPLKGED